MRTGYEALDKLLERLYRRKNELLKVLEHPGIPLHTNASENDLQTFVTKRKISGGTMSRDGRVARNVILDETALELRRGNVSGFSFQYPSVDCGLAPVV
ncbi:transposase [Rhizobium sp.]|uniref:IS66 family transposase n=1 Tax=Rhizobium sp. TaxID=391 RepID=UPI00389AAE57